MTVKTLEPTPVPTHAARQLANGWWTSKLGPSFDIEHIDLNAIAGGEQRALVQTSGLNAASRRRRLAPMPCQDARNALGRQIQGATGRGELLAQGH